jgi:hypothetical protein
MSDFDFEAIIDKTMENKRCMHVLFTHLSTLTPHFDYASDGTVSTEVVYNAFQESFLEASKAYPVICTADYFVENIDGMYAVMYYYITNFVSSWCATGALPEFTEAEQKEAESQGLPNPSFVSLISYKLLECFKDAGRPANATLH